MAPGTFIHGITIMRLYGENLDGTIVDARTGLIFRQTTIRLSARNMFLAPFWENPWMCHAYDGVRVQSGPEPQHGRRDFGSKIHAVHARARKLFGLWAIPPDECYARFE